MKVLNSYDNIYSAQTIERHGYLIMDNNQINNYDNNSGRNPNGQNGNGGNNNGNNQDPKKQNLLILLITK